VAKGAGLVFPDKRNPTVYRHLQELYVLNEHYPHTIIGEENILFSLLASVENNHFDGFFLTVATGRSFCAGSSLEKG
jgi:hypothetical protein